MSTFFLTIIITVSSIIIINLLSKNNKLKSRLFNNDEQLVDENKNHTENVNPLKEVQDISIGKIKINPNTPTKNTFLHGADDFGEMKKGVVLDGNTNSNENEKGDGFEIL
jgi:hypothetical protein